MGRKLEGVLEVGATQNCDGIQLVGTIPELSFLGLVFSIVNEVDETLANGIATALGPLSGLGIDDATASLVLGASPVSMAVAVEGSPALPDVNIDSPIVQFFYDQFKKAAEALTLRLSAKLVGTSQFETEMRVLMDPTDTSKDVALATKPHPVTGNVFGPSLYTKMSMTEITTALPTTVLTYGLSLTLQICVSDCDKVDRELIYVTGDVVANIITGAAPATTFGGLLALEGTWSKAFGIPFLHITNAVAGMTFNPMTFPVPASMLLGASVCFGSETNCDSKSDPLAIIDGAAYLGVDVNVPSNNFFVGLVSRFSMRQVFNVLGEVSSVFVSLNDILPDFVIDSYIEPFDVSLCDTLDVPVNSTSAGAIDLDCYAYVAIAPFGPVDDIVPSTPAVELSLNQGVAFGGKFKLATSAINVGFRIKAEVNFFTPSPKFLIDAEMEEFVIGGVLELGKEIENGHAVGGPRFYVNADTATNVYAADIEAAVALPFIRSYGYVDLVLNDEKFSFDGKISLFDGVIESQVICNWNWDFSSFYLKVSNVAFSPALVINDLVIDISPQPGDLEVYLKADITVLFFARIAGEFSLSQDGDLINVWFSVTADVKLVETTVSGSALVDTDNIANTDFGEFTVTFAPGALVEGIIEAAEVVVEAVTEVVDAAIEAGKEVIKGIGRAIDALGPAIDFMKDQWSELGNGIEALFTGDFDGALNSVINIAENFAEFFKPGEWAEAVLDGIEDVTDALGLTETKEEGPLNRNYKDKFGCYFQYIKIRKTIEVISNVCDAVIGWTGADCDKVSIEYEYSESDDFHNDACVNLAKERITFVQSQVNHAVVVDTGRQDTRNVNQGLSTFKDDGGFDPSKKPNFSDDDITTTVACNGDGTASAAFAGNMRQLSQNGGYESSPVAFNKVEPLDMSSEEAFEESLERARANVAGVIGTKASEKQGLVTNSLATHIAATVRQQFTVKFPGSLVASVGCSGEEAALQRPVIDKYDPDCVNKQLPDWGVVFRLTSKRRGLSESNAMCGSCSLTRTWVAIDMCGQTHSITQTLKVYNEAPTIVAPGMKTLTTKDDLLDLSVTGGEATVAAACTFNRLYTDFVDSPITQVVSGGGCKHWTMSRTFRVRNNFGDACVDGFETAVQQFVILDQTPPTFVSAPPTTVTVPFFENTAADNSIPVIEDIAPGDFAANNGLVAGSTTLFSTDSALTYSNAGDPAREDTCVQDGLASFTRTWTAMDGCQNTATMEQMITIQHPTPWLTTTKVAGHGEFYHAIGVQQRSESCLPGKTVETGRHDVVSDTSNWESDIHACIAGGWDAYGCRLTNKAVTTTQVKPIKPEFTSLPEDRTIVTSESPDPDNLGRPTATSYCNTPWEIIYRDEAPQAQSECGVWTVKRVWILRPVFKDCPLGVAEDNELVSTYAQTITIRDVDPPQFIQKPAVDQKVPFLTDYGPTVTGVPLVQDIATNEWIAGLGLVSYPIQLEYSDSAEFPAVPADECESGLAVITRVWTTRDVCQNTQTWTQTIRIVQGEDLMWGAGASPFQVANLGGVVDIDESTISQEVASGGWDARVKDSLVAGGAETADSPNAALCSNNQLDYSMVFQQCPHELKKSVVQSKSVLVGAYVDSEHGRRLRTGGRVLRKNKHECSVSKIDEIVPNGELVEVPVEDLPVDFAEGPSNIKAASQHLFRTVPDLLTGPRFIECSDVAQSTCVPTEMSTSPSVVTVTPDANDGILRLQGTEMVYNRFDVKINHWFHEVYLDDAGREVEIEAPGFVLVNVIDHVTMGLSNSKKPYTTVVRDFYPVAYQCKEDNHGYPKYYPPVFGNDYHRGEHGEHGEHGAKDIGEHGRAHHGFGYELRRVVVKDGSQDPTSHMLVNIVTDVENPLNLPHEDVCSSMRYLFERDEYYQDEHGNTSETEFEHGKKKYRDSIGRGSYLFGNPATKVEIHDHQWLGGQIAMAGSKMELKDVEMLCGIFAANVACPAA